MGHGAAYYLYLLHRLNLIKYNGLIQQPISSPPAATPVATPAATSTSYASLICQLHSQYCSKMLLEFGFQSSQVGAVLAVLLTAVLAVLLTAVLAVLLTAVPAVLSIAVPAVLSIAVPAVLFIGGVCILNFIHRMLGQNPEIEMSFAKQNSLLDREQLRLNIQILRVHTIDKQRALAHVFTYNQNQLCEIFTRYEPSPYVSLSIHSLLSSKQLKLIKSDGKIYFGEIVRKQREGKGISITKEGRLYEGSFANNQKNGQGIEIYPNGNLFIGQFLNSKKHGQGRFYWFNLSSKNANHDQQVEHYEGEWWGGLPDGQGVHQKLNGDLYMGLFKNGLKHGQGSEWFANGDFYKGEYVNGLSEGYGEYVWQDGSSFKGDFKQGLRNGYGVWKASPKKAQTYKGHYAMDKKVGYGVYCWQTGWSYKGNFENDYRHGYGELYDGQNKLSYRGFWQNGQQSEREAMLGKGEKDLNFRSVQFSRHGSQSRQFSSNRRENKNQRYDVVSVRSRSIKQKETRLEPPADYATLSQMIERGRARPQSLGGKRQREVEKSNKAQRTPRDKDSSASGGHMMVGTIKSNLFVPVWHRR